jgi:hypothetical protein
VHETLVVEILVQDKNRVPRVEAQPRHTAHTAWKRRGERLPIFAQGMENDRGLLAQVPPTRCKIVERVEKIQLGKVLQSSEEVEGAVRSEKSVEGLEWVWCGASRLDSGRWSMRERGFVKEMG